MIIVLVLILVIEGSIGIASKQIRENRETTEKVRMNDFIKKHPEYQNEYHDLYARRGNRQSNGLVDNSISFFEYIQSTKDGINLRRSLRAERTAIEDIAFYIVLYNGNFSAKYKNVFYPTLLLFGLSVLWYIRNIFILGYRGLVYVVKGMHKFFSKQI